MVYNERHQRAKRPTTSSCAEPLEAQPVGWSPDLNDGVPDVGRKGAGVLRELPNINWNRGKDVQSAPWYHRFGGDRINDCHLSLTEKQAA